ncbi:MAG: hypothetical protein M3Q24_00185 [bacterium]|nr:hypothetical protein [bacterium]
MSIYEEWSKIKPIKEKADIETVSFNERGEIEDRSIIKKFFLIFLIILVSGASFGLGKLSNRDTRAGVKIEYNPSLTNSLESQVNASIVEKEEIKKETAATTTVSSNSAVVGSVKGTKYHYPHCPGAKQISSANLITFKNSAAAEAAGYTLALNCKPKI